MALTSLYVVEYIDHDGTCDCKHCHKFFTTNSWDAAQWFAEDHGGVEVFEYMYRRTVIEGKPAYAVPENERYAPRERCKQCNEILGTCEHTGLLPVTEFDPLPKGPVSEVVVNTVKRAVFDAIGEETKVGIKETRNYAVNEFTGKRFEKMIVPDGFDAADEREQVQALSMCGCAADIFGGMFKARRVNVTITERRAMTFIGRAQMMLPCNTPAGEILNDMRASQDQFERLRPEFISALTESLAPLEVWVVDIEDYVEAKGFDVEIRFTIRRRP